MNYENLKLWIPYRKLLLKPKLQDKKNVCMFFFGENTNFFDVYNTLDIKKSFCRMVYMPNVVRPFRAMMTNEDRKNIMSRGLRPIRDFLGSYSKVQGKNFFYYTKIFDVLDKRYKLKKYNTKRSMGLYQNYFRTLNGLNKEEYKKTILYCVDTTKPTGRTIFYKRFYSVYNLIDLWLKGKLDDLPFDNVIMFVNNGTKPYYVKIFDKDLKNNSLGRLRNSVIKIVSIQPSENEFDHEHESNSFISKLDDDADVKTDNLMNEIDTKDLYKSISDNDIQMAMNIVADESDLAKFVDKETLMTSIENYLNHLKNTSKSIKNIFQNKSRMDLNRLGTKSIVYNVVGDEDKATKITNIIDKVDNDVKIKLIQNAAEKIVKKPKIIIQSNNKFIEYANLPAIVNNHTPAILIEKRRRDFEENLKTDITNAFKTLELQKPPLKVKNITIKTLKSPVSEINESIKDRYFVDLEDVNGKVTTANVDVPHLDKHGFFTINGIQQIMVNQLVRFPITFPAPDKSRFESAFSTMEIINKKIKNGSYFIIYIGSYKVPFTMFMSTQKDLVDHLNDFGVSVEISE